MDKQMSKTAQPIQPPSIDGKILDIVLDAYWFDKIALGRKDVEYRRICQHWRSRLFPGKTPNEVSRRVEGKECRAEVFGEQLKRKFICFRRAYTSTTLYAEIDHVDVGPCPYDGWYGDFYRIHFTPLADKGMCVVEHRIIDKNGKEIK